LMRRVTLNQTTILDSWSVDCSIGCVVLRASSTAAFFGASSCGYHSSLTKPRTTQPAGARAYAQKRTQHLVLPEDLQAGMEITANKPNGFFFSAMAERVEAQLRQGIFAIFSVEQKESALASILASACWLSDPLPFAYLQYLTGQENPEAVALGGKLLGSAWACDVSGGLLRR
jgi:hypothetical protein